MIKQVDHDDTQHAALTAFNDLWTNKFKEDSLLVFSTGRSHHLYEALRVRCHRHHDGCLQLIRNPCNLLFKETSTLREERQHSLPALSLITRHESTVMHIAFCNALTASVDRDRTRLTGA